ncbi:MAG: hypothetical protein VW741_03315 [Flammeovirgaceae bacterium]
MVNIKKLHPIDIELTRLGKDNDGGYVIPKIIIKKSDGVLSFGINKDWSFENDFYKKNKVKIHCYDHTVKLFSLMKYSIKCFFLSLFYLIILDRKRFNRSLNGINIIQKYNSFFNKNIVHFKKRIWTNNKNENIKISDAIDKIISLGVKNIFIKMDIEGDEYETLNYISNYKKNIIGLVVEFHQINKRSKDFNSIINDLKSSFYIAHVHGNNYSKIDNVSNLPSSLEVSFINKEIVNKPVLKSKNKFPISGLDQPNKHSRPDIELNFR